MPFDPFVPEDRPLSPDLGFLARVLREGPSSPHWPPTMRWNYSTCDTCAIEVARHLWKRDFIRNSSPFGLLAKTLSEVFHMTPPEAQRIFFNLHAERPELRQYQIGSSDYDLELSLAFDKVTPADVADAIETYLGITPCNTKSATEHLADCSVS